MDMWTLFKQKKEAASTVEEMGKLVDELLGVSSRLVKENMYLNSLLGQTSIIVHSLGETYEVDTSASE